MPWCNINKNNYTEYKKIENIGNTVGIKKKNIFHFIKSEHIILDMLHLFFRISDRLTMLLLKDLEQLDESYSTLLCEDNFFFEKYVNFLTSLNLRNTLYKKDKYFGLRELNGVEKRKVFNNIDFSTHIYGNPPTFGVHLKNEQWKTLNSIVNECNSNTQVRTIFKSEPKRGSVIFKKTRIMVT